MRLVNLLDENLAVWNRFRAGDAHAVAIIMEAHYNDLFNYATRFTSDVELVKDCIQDLFLALWKNRETISETSFVKYYLLKSLRRNLFRALNKKKRRKTIAYGDFEFEYFFADSVQENEIIQRQNLSDLSLKIAKLIARLSSREQEIIYIRFYMNADIEEIAEIMGLQTQSVHNLLHKALVKLKRATSGKAFPLSYFFCF